MALERYGQEQSLTDLARSSQEQTRPGLLVRRRQEQKAQGLMQMEPAQRALAQSCREKTQLSFLVLMEPERTVLVQSSLVQTLASRVQKGPAQRVPARTEPAQIGRAQTQAAPVQTKRGQSSRALEGHPQARMVPEHSAERPRCNHR